MCLTKSHGEVKFMKQKIICEFEIRKIVLAVKLVILTNKKGKTLLNM